MHLAVFLCCHWFTHIFHCLCANYYFRESWRCVYSLYSFTCSHVLLSKNISIICSLLPCPSVQILDKLIDSCHLLYMQTLICFCPPIIMQQSYPLQCTFFYLYLFFTWKNLLHLQIFSCRSFIFCYFNKGLLPQRTLDFFLLGILMHAR